MIVHAVALHSRITACAGGQPSAHESCYQQHCDHDDISGERNPGARPVIGEKPKNRAKYTAARRLSHPKEGHDEEGLRAHSDHTYAPSSKHSQTCQPRVTSHNLSQSGHRPHSAYCIVLKPTSPTCPASQPPSMHPSYQGTPAVSEKGHHVQRLERPSSARRQPSTALVPGQHDDDDSSSPHPPSGRVGPSSPHRRCDDTHAVGMRRTRA